MKSKQLTGTLMLLLAALMWGMSYVVQSLTNGLGTFTVAFFKCVGGIVLFILALIKKERFTKETIIGGVIIGCVAGIAVVLQQKGLELSSAANTSFITALYIVFTPILGIFVNKKPNKKIWIAIVIALIGMYLLCINGEFVIKIGDLLLVVGAILFALQIILIDKYIGNVDAIAFTSVQQIAGAIVVGILMIFIDKPTLADLSKNILQILYLSLISGASAQLIQNRFQRDVEPSLSSLVMSFESVFGALFGWIILSQALSLREIGGCILIFIAILIAE